MQQCIIYIKIMYELEKMHQNKNMNLVCGWGATTLIVTPTLYLHSNSQFDTQVELNHGIIYITA